MNNLVIGSMPQERRTLNLGEYAEEAVLITEENQQNRKDRYSLKPIRLTLPWSI